VQERLLRCLHTSYLASMHTLGHFCPKLHVSGRGVLSKMDAMSIAQLANPFIQTVFIVVMGLGYYFTIRNLRSQVNDMNQARTTGGRPL
jgi:hypothetical protein